jgi:hypothetical protein
MTNRFDPELLRELLAYDPTTGQLRWRERDRRHFPSDHAWRAWNARWAGEPALNCPDVRGYLHGRLFRQEQYAHRIAFAIYHGRWPSEQIDHINRDRGDNRIENLRDVDRLANGKNAKLNVRNTSGHVGVCRRGRRWIARFRHNNKDIHIGYFDTVEQAADARRRAASEYGFTPSHGTPL